MAIKLDIRTNPLAYASDQELVDELNRREALVKWARKALAPPSNLCRSFASPSCKVENWDCTQKNTVIKSKELK